MANVITKVSQQVAKTNGIKKKLEMAILQNGFKTLINEYVDAAATGSLTGYEGLQMLYSYAKEKAQAKIEKKKKK